MTLPLYITRGGEQVFQQPFTAKDVQFFGFWVKADMKALEAICNKYLNAPLGEIKEGKKPRFAPAIKHVQFVFNRLGKLYATNPPDKNRGWYKEQEAAIWMLVLDRVEQNLYWFHPYMLVDSSYALCMGREIYGFPKEFGWFDIPDGPDSPMQMHVDTVVAKELQPNIEARKEILFCARRTGTSTTPLSHKDHSSLESLVKHTAELLEIGPEFLAHLELEKNLFKDLLGMKIPMVFLKQFRDGAQPDHACYQLIQECATKMTRFHSARVYFHSYQIEFEDFATHPIRANLGFAPGPIKVDMAFWTRFDFEIGLCKEINPTP
ncbi:MAG TPA: hypothetical protein VKN35_15950 [Xanthomonadales bacterium]|nr:hypothetical protein [Xanthomonadales bacterium]